ncbi:MAG: mechanosensitive ion channel family protein [Gammaproteobacteria bacterium]|nr:mechanosensitive ion channel family protein [Gammaproteobacteria bacterium]
MPENMQNFLEQFDYASLLQDAIRVAIIIVVAIVVWFVISFAISRFQARLIRKAEARGEGIHGVKERAETVGSLLRKVLAAIYWVMVVFTLLSQVGIDIGALIAGAGIVALALAFGAQSLVKNYISGFFMVLENQISVGDIAIINGTWGTVEMVNFRTTILRSMDGIVHVFSNGNIDELANATKGWGGYVFKLHVGYKEDTNRVIEVIKRVGEDMKKDEAFGANMLGDMEIHGVNELTDSSVVIRGRFKTTPMNQWSTGREFLARIKRTFDAENIRIALPRRELYMDAESTPMINTDQREEPEGGEGPGVRN